MAIRKLRYEGDPVLGKVCKEVKEMTPHLQELAQDAQQPSQPSTFLLAAVLMLAAFMTAMMMAIIRNAPGALIKMPMGSTASGRI